VSSDPGLVAARRLADEATPGPWSADDEHGDLPGATPAWVVSRTDETGAYLGDLAYTVGALEQPNAEFIAWCREGVPALLDQLEAAHQRFDGAQEVLKARMRCTIGEITQQEYFAVLNPFLNAFEAEPVTDATEGRKQ
jgi:hypothetical protein